MHQEWANDDLRKVQSALQQYSDVINNNGVVKFLIPHAQ
jgi:hypothetical protein